MFRRRLPPALLSLALAIACPPRRQRDLATGFVQQYPRSILLKEADP